MSINFGATSKLPKTACFEAYTPKLISVFREGYPAAFFKADARLALPCKMRLRL